MVIYPIYCHYFLMFTVLKSKINTSIISTPNPIAVFNRIWSGLSWAILYTRSVVKEDDLDG